MVFTIDRALLIGSIIALILSTADGQSDFLGSACLDSVCDNGLPCLSVTDQSTCSSTDMMDSLCTCGGIGTSSHEIGKCDASNSPVAWQVKANRLWNPAHVLKEILIAVQSGPKLVQGRSWILSSLGLADNNSISQQRQGRSTISSAQR